MSSYISFMVSSTMRAEVIAFSKENEQSVSGFIRDAIQAAIDLRKGKAFDARRLAVICEYTQLVADEWLKRHAPERRDEIIDAVDVRLEKYHGG